MKLSDIRKDSGILQEELAERPYFDDMSKYGRRVGRHPDPPKASSLHVLIRR